MKIIEFKEDNLTMLRGVLACAGVKDVRYYLNGIHITDQHVEGTDGHRFARFKTPIMPDVELTGINTIVPRFKIAPSTVSLTIEIDNVGGIKVTQFHKNSSEDISILRAINGIFPDLDQVTPADDAGASARSIILNPHLITTVTKAARFKDFCPVEITNIFDGMNCAFRVKIYKLPYFKFYVMPARR